MLSWIVPGTGVSSLAVLDGTAAIGARDHMIHLWDLVSSHAVGKLRGHTDAVLALESDRKRSLLVSGGNDRSVRAWANCSIFLPFFTHFLHNDHNIFSKKKAESGGVESIFGLH